MVRPPRRLSHRQDGSATVEIALLTPLMLMVVLLVVGMGRIALAYQAVQAVAIDTARAASLARSAEQASADGQLIAQAPLSDRSLYCADTAVDVDTSQFAVQAGQRAEVVATVTCVVDLGDVSGLTGLPGRFTVTKTARSPVDVYRGRQP